MGDTIIKPMYEFNWKAVKQEKLLFVAGDAGGANVLAGMIQHRLLEGDCLLNQPAANIFKSQGITNNFIFEKDIDFQNYGIMFSSTGKKDGFEIRMMNMALESNTKVIAILDHWVNYQSRFLLESKFVQPSGIMVTDKVSMMRAREIFDDSRLFFEPNYYLDKQLAQAQANTQLEIDVLVLDEIGGFTQESEFPSLLYYPRLIKKLKNSNPDSKICVRAHPSRNTDERRYLENLGIELSTRESLGEDISRSYMILGLSSMSFYIACLSGKRVMSFDPIVTKKILPLSNVDALEMSGGEQYID